MIYDQLKNAHIYFGVSEHVAMALRFLQTSDFSRLADGRHEIDGGNAYAMILTYQTRLPEGASPEAHDRFIDIMCMLDGEEQLLVGFRDEMDAVVDRRPDNDIVFYKGNTQPIRIGPGRFLMLFPDDVHAPAICLGNPQAVRKVVVKVTVEGIALPN